jgi:hypothetical protein
MQSVKCADFDTFWLSNMQLRLTRRWIRATLAALWLQRNENVKNLS